MRSTRLVPALAAGCLVFAACGGGSSSDSAAETTPAPTEPSASAAPATEAAAPDAADTAVPAALQFSAPLVGGGELDATTLAGTPTVFWFWAPT